MDNKTIYNGGGQITYKIIMMWEMMDLEGFNSEFSSEETENENKFQH